MQLDVFEIHSHENNRESLDHLNDNRPHFNKQCKCVFDLLMSGVQLTVYSAITQHHINSVPRRILDLKEKGVLINDRWDESVKPKIKIWFIDEINKKLNNQKIK